MEKSFKRVPGFVRLATCIHAIKGRAGAAPALTPPSDPGAQRQRRGSAGMRRNGLNGWCLQPSHRAAARVAGKSLHSLLWRKWMLVAWLAWFAGAWARGSYDLPEIPGSPGNPSGLFQSDPTPYLMTDQYLVYLETETQAGLRELIARSQHAHDPSMGWLQSPRAEIVARQAPLAVSDSGKPVWAEIVDSSWVECVHHEMSPEIQLLLTRGTHDQKDRAAPLIMEVHRYGPGGWIAPGRASPEGVALSALCERAGMPFPLSELPEQTSRGAPLCYPNSGRTARECAQAMSAASAVTSAHPVVEVPPDDIELRQAAQAGNADAQYCLGLRELSHSNLVAARDEEGLQWLRMAAAQGDARAQARLGLVYYTGRLLAQDLSEAATLYRKAADAGNPDAQRRLARMLRSGQGVTADPAEAERLEAAARNAPAPAGCSTTVPHRSVVEGSAPAGASGVTGRPLPLFPQLLSAAQAGDAAAQYQLGSRYFNEQRRDAAWDAEAQKWFFLAAAQGYALAEDRLGGIYYFGRGLPQNYTEAAKWYRRAAEHGNVDAMTRLGGMYRDGKGVPQDRDEARRWTNQASEVASRPARHREWLFAGGVVLAMLGFGAALVSLQRNRLSGWHRAVAATLVHVVGLGLLVNTAVTFGLPELLFPDCGYGWLAASCSYANKTLNGLATAVRNWQMISLVWTFMGMFGLIFHALAVWYFIYVVRAWKGRAH